jgi:SAM-dependent methyltransferase
MSEPQIRPRPAILETVDRYYSEKLRHFGATHRGVDWSTASSQELRFNRLLQVVEGHDDGSVIDYGCGYGALLDHLGAIGRRVTYCGFDVSETMIQAALARHAGVARASFTADASQLAPAEYVVASGIFNVKLAHTPEAWWDYVCQTLTHMASLGRRGLAFNMLTTHSDPDRRRDDLFYADPIRVFEMCRQRFSPRVALLHDYPLHEFTTIVRT